MVKKLTLFYFLICIFVILDGFLLYNYGQRYFEFVFSALVFLLFLADASFRKSISKEKNTFNLLILLLGISTMQMLVGRYGGVESLSNTFLFIGMFCLFYYNDSNTISQDRLKQKLDSIVFVCATISLVYQFIVRITEEPNVVYNIYNIYYSLGRDKNVLGIIVFCYFWFSLQHRSWIGLALCIGYAATLRSRMLLVNIAIFLIVTVFRKTAYSIWNKLFGKRAWLAFAFSFIVIIIFSFVFIAYCTANGLGTYQETWADSSNYMRMTSNIFALEKIIKEPYFILFGTDGYIYDYLGITNSVRFLGERIVQPHNDIINLLVRSGLIYSIIYWYLYGKLIKKIINKQNIAFFIALFIASMFIRPIFVGAQGLIVMYGLCMADYKSHSCFVFKRIKFKTSKIKSLSRKGF